MLPQSLPNVSARFEKMESIEVRDYMAICRKRLELAISIRETMLGFDAIVGPTIPISPPTLEEVSESKSYHQHNMGAARNTSTVNMLDLCAITIPVCLDKKGMPVGLQIICPLNLDEKALAIALSFEKVLGNARQRIGTPPLCP